MADDRPTDGSPPSEEPRDESAEPSRDLGDTQAWQPDDDGDQTQAWQPDDDADRTQQFQPGDESDRTRVWQADEQTQTLPAAGEPGSNTVVGQPAGSWSGRAQVPTRGYGDADAPDGIWEGDEHAGSPWWLPVAVGALALLILAMLGVGVWLIADALRDDPVAVPSPTPTPTESPSPSPSPEPPPPPTPQPEPPEPTPSPTPEPTPSPEPPPEPSPTPSPEPTGGALLPILPPGNN